MGKDVTMGRIAVSDTPNIQVLEFKDIRSYVITTTFAMLSVALPWVLHQFHLAGTVFLPMHVFVLVAGLAFGWRAGSVVGLLTPVVSYGISGLPGLLILPQITIEITLYGLVSGLLREKLNWRVIWSLLGAMASGRIALLIAALVTYHIGGQANSVLGVEPNPLFVLWAAIRQGWPGIVIQLTAIPFLVYLLDRLARGAKHGNDIQRVP